MGPARTDGVDRMDEIDGGARVSDHDPIADGAAIGGRTGDAAVDEALLRLRSLDDAPVREHVQVFEAVHAALQGRLADVED